MIEKKISFKAADGKELLGYRWSPDTEAGIKGSVQIVHGMAETAIRYHRFAEKLCEAGYVAYACDQRGHGRTAGTLENVGYIADSDSFSVLVEDQHRITEMIRKEKPGLPVFLFGHSMGSFVSQGYIQKHGSDIDGLVLSATNGKTGLLLDIGKMLAVSEIKKVGRKARSPKLNQLSFGTYNSAFKPNRTDFDWLSRDNAEVDKYIQDPFCGGVFTAGFYLDMILFLKEIQKPENIRKIPLSLPILLVAGSRDPVGRAGKGVLLLKETYRKQGIQDLSSKLYEGARHEILNETNRDEVMKDVIAWLSLHLKK